MHFLTVKGVYLTNVITIGEIGDFFRTFCSSGFPTVSYEVHTHLLKGELWAFFIILTNYKIINHLIVKSFGGLKT